MTIKVAEAGVKAIHCEKPMATTFGEAKRMVEACEENDVVLTFNHQRRFGEPFNKAKELLDAGAIGQLERIEAFTSNLYDWGTHWFDMMFYYNDETPVEWVIGQIDARGGRPIFGAIVEGQGLSFFKWRNGVSGLMVTGYQGAPAVPLRSTDCAQRLMGTEGMIEVGVSNEVKVRLRNAETKGTWRVIDMEGGIHGSDLHTAAILDLVESLKTGREPVLAARKALQATELIFATYESSRKRGRVDLPLEIEDSPFVAMLNAADVTTWPADDVIANGIKIHYYRTGGNKPPLVLAHGFSDNGLCWTPVARALEHDYDVIMVDARGHGLSDAPDEAYAYEDRAADLVGLIQALGLEKPTVMGHSMGASTVAAAAAEYPNVIGKAILEDPPWRDEDPGEDLSADEIEERVKEWHDRLLANKEKSREALIAGAREESPTWSEAELGPWAESKRQLSLKVLHRSARPWTPWREVAEKIACPTLLITADTEAGAIVSPEVAEEAAALNDQIQVVRIEGAGHSIRREAFKPYMQAVRNFLVDA
jgi:pimeloyl-ACP methyl ester carboxylesterase/predicted dehydrogenase